MKPVWSFRYIWLSSFLWLMTSKSVLSKWVDFTHTTLGVFSCQPIQSPLSNISLPSISNNISSSVSSELYSFFCEDLNHFPLIFLFPVLVGFTDKFCSSALFRDLFFPFSLKLSFVFKSVHIWRKNIQKNKHSVSRAVTILKVQMASFHFPAFVFLRIKLHPEKKDVRS